MAVTSDPESMCGPLAEWTPLAMFVGLSGTPWEIPADAASASVAADVSPLLWTALVGSCGLVAFVVSLCVLWKQATLWNTVLFSLEDVVGVSEAYLRSRAMEGGVPALLLQKRKLTPVEAEAADEAAAEGADDEAPTVSKFGAAVMKKRTRKRNADGEPEGDYEELELGDRIPNDLKGSAAAE